MELLLITALLACLPALFEGVEATVSSGLDETPNQQLGLQQPLDRSRVDGVDDQMTLGARGGAGKPVLVVIGFRRGFERLFPFVFENCVVFIETEQRKHCWVRVAGLRTKYVSLL